MLKQLLFIFLFLTFTSYAIAQGCTTLGQTPATAFPVCGISVFNQSSVPTCTNKTVKTFCNDGVTYSDANPYWYQFTCYATGTLGFLVTPNVLTDDYDWILYDVTNRNPSSVYDSTNFIVAYNWSGNTSTESARGYTGITGAGPAGTTLLTCATNPQELGGSPPYSDASTIASMPTIIVGHTYLLMVSHYSGTNQSGYTLKFTGGTASITDPTIPDYLKASGICGGDKVYIKLSKQVQCKTIAADGTDFSLSPANVAISGATGYGCTNSFSTDSIIVQLNNPLPPANYSIIQKNGTDGNTLLDNCYNSVVVGTSASFTITAQQLIKAAFTYQINYGCVYDTVNVQLGGQNIVTWSWNIDNSKTLTQANPSIIYNVYGQHQITLYAANSVCADTASATFNLINSPIKSGFITDAFACPNDTVHFTNTSTGNIALWFWDFGNGQTSTLQQPPAQTYPSGNSMINYPIRLSVTDSIGCSDTTYKLIEVAPNCYIAVPSAFTPNGDGRNDYLYPLNAYKAVNLSFKVYNRFGQIIFTTTDWTIKWDGTYNSIPQPSGTYVWMLEYTDRDTGKKMFQKGTTVLIR